MSEAEHYISAVHHDPKELADKQNRIFSEYGITEHHHRAGDTDYPKTEGQQRLVPFFTVQPLVDEAKGENSLADETPGHQRTRNGFVGKNGVDIIGLAAQQPEDCQPWKKSGHKAHQGRDFGPEAMIMQIANVHAIGDKLAEDNDQVVAQDAIDHQQEGCEDTQLPEEQGRENASCFFRDNPLAELPC